jgi:hypothetical protein
MKSGGRREQLLLADFAESDSDPQVVESYIQRITNCPKDGQFQPKMPENARRLASLAMTSDRGVTRTAR